MAKKQTKPLAPYNGAKEGPLTYRELQERNAALGRHANLEPEDPIEVGLRKAYMGHLFQGTTNPNDLRFTPQKLYTTDHKEYYGSSTFDRDALSYNDFLNYQHERALNQGTLTKLGIGVLGGVTSAATSVAQGAGMIGAGIANLGILAHNIFHSDADDAEYINIFDNAYANAISNFEEGVNEAMPLYKTDLQENSSLLSAANMFSANGIAEILKATGYTVGSIYTGGILSTLGKVSKVARGAQWLAKTFGAGLKTQKAAGLGAQLFLGSTMSGLVEGHMEGLNVKREMDTAYLTQRQAQRETEVQAALEKYGPESPEFKILLDSINRRYEEDVQMAHQQSTEAAGYTMLVNGITSALSNASVFGNVYKGGYRANNYLNKVIMKGSSITDGFESTAKTSFLGYAKNLVKSPLTEGAQEMSQKWISAFNTLYQSNDIHNEEQRNLANDEQWLALMDENAGKDIRDSFNVAIEGLKKEMFSEEALYEGAVGAIIGALGLPSIRTKIDADGNKKRSLSWDGGIIGDVREYAREAEEQKKIADYLNKRFQGGAFLETYQGLIRGIHFNKMMDQYLEEGNEYKYEQTQLAKMYSDIAMLEKVGGVGALQKFLSETLGGELEGASGKITDEVAAKIFDGTIVNNGSKQYSLFADVINAAETSYEGLDDNSKQAVKDSIKAKATDMLKLMTDMHKSRVALELEYGLSHSDEEISQLNYLEMKKKHLGNFLIKELQNQSTKYPEGTWEHTAIQEALKQIGNYQEGNDPRSVLAKFLRKDNPATLEGLNKIFNSKLGTNFTNNVLGQILNDLKSVEADTKRIQKNPGLLTQKRRTSEELLKNSLLADIVENKQAELDKISSFRELMNWSRQNSISGDPTELIEHLSSNVKYGKKVTELSDKYDKNLRDRHFFQTLASSATITRKDDQGNEVTTNLLEAGDDNNSLSSEFREIFMDAHNSGEIDNLYETVKKFKSDHENKEDYSHYKTFIDGFLGTVEEADEIAKTANTNPSGQDPKPPTTTNSNSSKPSTTSNSGGNPTPTTSSSGSSLLHHLKPEEIEEVIQALIKKFENGSELTQITKGRITNAEEQIKTAIAGRTDLDFTWEDVQAVLDFDTEADSNTNEDSAGDKATGKNEDLTNSKGDEVKAIEENSSKTEVTSVNPNGTKPPTFRTGRTEFDINTVDGHSLDGNLQESKGSVQDFLRETNAFTFIKVSDKNSTGEDSSPLLDYIIANGHPEIRIAFKTFGDSLYAFMLIEHPNGNVKIGNTNYQVLGNVESYTEDQNSKNAFNTIKETVAESIADNPITPEDDSKGLFFHDLHKTTYRIAGAKVGRRVKLSGGRIQPVNKVTTKGMPLFSMSFGNTTAYTEEIDSTKTDLVKPKASNSTDGRLYFYTREADGRYYPRAAKIGRMNEVELKPDTAFWDSTLGEDVRSILEGMSNAKTRKEVLEHLVKLSSIFYMPNFKTIGVRREDGDYYLVSSSGQKVKISGESSTKLYEKLGSTFNWRFQIKFDKDGKTATTSFINAYNAGVIFTDLAQAHNEVPSLDIVPTDAMTEGFTPQAKDLETLVPSITVDGKDYSITRIATGYMVKSGGNEVTNVETIHRVLHAASEKVNSSLGDYEIHDLSNSGLSDNVRLTTYKGNALFTIDNESFYIEDIEGTGKGKYEKVQEALQNASILKDLLDDVTRITNGTPEVHKGGTSDPKPKDTDGTKKSGQGGSEKLVLTPTGGTPKPLAGAEAGRKPAGENNSGEFKDTPAKLSTARNALTKAIDTVGGSFNKISKELIITPEGHSALNLDVSKLNSKQLGEISKALIEYSKSNKTEDDYKALIQDIDNTFGNCKG